MTCLTVSSDDVALSCEVAERVAKATGLDFIGPRVLEELAAAKGVDVELLQAVLDPQRYRTNPSWPLHLAWVQVETLQRMCADNVVSSGLAAHLFVHDVSHVLQLRVLSDHTDEAHKAQRTQWSLDCCGRDESAAANYDFTISVKHIDQSKLVPLIKDMAGHRRFQSMTWSRACLENLTLAARVRAALLPHHPHVRVLVSGKTVWISVRCWWGRRKVTASVRRIAEGVPGVVQVEVQTVRSLSDPPEPQPT